MKKFKTFERILVMVMIGLLAANLVVGSMTIKAADDINQSIIDPENVITGTIDDHSDDAAQPADTADISDELTDETFADDAQDENISDANVASQDASALHALTYEDDDVLVTVEELEAGAFPENCAELSVAPVTKENPDTETQYKEVEEKLYEKAENEDYDIAGFLAYDIKIMDSEGNKLEPNGKVKVSMSYKQEPVLSEDAQETVANDATLESTADLDVTVMHLEEDEAGNVTDVVDLSKVIPEGQTEEQAENKIEKIETDENNAVSEMVFETGGFSVYTVTWTKKDESTSGNNIVVPKGYAKTITKSGGGQVLGYNHSWGTSDSNVVTVTYDREEGTFTFHNVGTAIVTHTYYIGISKYTDQWNITVYDPNLANIVVHYVDENGTPLSGKEGNGPDVKEEGKWTSISTVFGEDIQGYTFQNAKIGELNGPEAKSIRWNNGMQYCNVDNPGNTTAGTTWSKTTVGSDEGYHLYMVYKQDTPTPEPDDPTPGSSETGNLSHRKYIEKNTDGTYDLTLDIVGAAGTETHPADVDVVVVFDISTSMKNNRANGKEYYKHAQDAVSSLVDTVSAKTSVNARWNLITFGSRAQTPSGWYTDKTQFKNLVENSTTPPDSNGTNYEAALKSASNTLNSARPNATTVVIFLTDGVPTFHGTNTQGGGNYTQEADYNGALNGAMSISSDKFYVVGINLANQSSNYRPNRNTAYYTGKDIADKMLEKSPATDKKVIDAQATELTNVFNDIAGEIINITVGDVTIYDQLTPEVQQVAGTGLKIKITDKSGNDVTVAEQAVAGNGIVASYNSTTKKLKLDFPDDYKLKQDYTYSVTITIEPSDAAELKYIANGYKYIDVGELNTDAPNATTKISEGVKGLYTNVENSAYVTYYEYKGDTKADKETKGLYNKPVVKLDTEPTKPADVTQEAKHEKYIKLNADGTYDLTLNIAGKVGQTVEPKNIDVILMLDATKSMNQDNKDGIKKMKEAADTLITSLEGKENVNVKWSAASFGNTYTKVSDWSTNPEDVKTKINNIQQVSTSGTNYCAAFDGITSLIASAKDNNEKIVVFLTDGEPNAYFTADDNQTVYVESGYNYTNTVKTNTQTYASRINCNSFYSVVIGDAVTIFNNDINPSIKATNKKVFKASTDDLSKVFGDISADITSILSNKVQVQDTLSKYIEVPTGAVLEINVRDDNGTVQKSANGTRTSASLVVTNPDGSKNKTGSTITASYDPDTKKLTMAFPPEYYLEPTYTYYITIKNIEPSNEAYLYYQNNSKTPNTGDDKTDASTDGWSAVSGTVSSKQPGFYSNDSAYVTYEFDGKKETLPYDKPVVKINPEKVDKTVKKVWGTNNTPVDITVILSATAAGRTITKSNCNQMPADSELTKTIKASKNMTYTWNDLPKYFYYRDSNGVAQKAEIQYSISEDTLPGYNVKVDVNGNITTITNTKIVEWKLVKDSTSDPSVKLAGAKFELSKTETVSGQQVTTTFYGESTVDDPDTTEDELGLVIWKDANGNGINQTKIPADTYTLKEVAAPNGYSCSTETWTIEIPYEGGKPTVKKDDGTVINPLSNNEPYEYRYSDAVLYSLPSTGGPGIFAIMFGGSLLMACAAGLVICRRRTDIVVRQ